MTETRAETTLKNFEDYYYKWITSVCSVVLSQELSLNGYIARRLVYMSFYDGF